MCVFAWLCVCLSVCMFVFVLVGHSAVQTPPRREGGRWTSLHESTSVWPIIHPILLSYYTKPLHPFTGYISPLHRLNLLYSANLYISLHYTHKQHKNTFLLGIYTVTHNHTYCTIGSDPFLYLFPPHSFWTCSPYVYVICVCCGCELYKLYKLLDVLNPSNTCTTLHYTLH